MAPPKTSTTTPAATPASTSTAAPTAGMVVIGDEILSGKVQDANSPYLARELYRLGVQLVRIVTVGDDPQQIGDEVKTAANSYDWVFTSGGIGPTHDDITITSIAAAFGVPAVTDATLASLLKRHYGARLTADHLLMALVPQGAELVAVPALRHPQLMFRNVFIFPGVPKLFRMKFEAIRARFQHTPLLFSELHLQQVDEGRIAETLRQTQTRFPPVRIGSYPDYEAAVFTVRVTVESALQAPQEQALAFLQAELPSLGVRIIHVSHG